jgi:bacillithiol system protein YtxJ
MAHFFNIETSEDLERLFAESTDHPVVVLKHSVTCPISTDVHAEVAALDGPVGLIVVQTARAVSDELAERTGIRHESPQAMVIREGRAVYHASHYDVTAKDIAGHLTGTPAD